MNKINLRALIAFSHDIIMTWASFGISIFLRLGTHSKWYLDEFLLPAGGALTLIAAIIYWRMGLYRGIWRYASVRDLTVLTKAVSLVILIFVMVMVVATRLEDLPRSVFLINWLVLLAMLGGPRLAYRIARDHRLDLKDAPNGKRRIPVLLAGAGDGAELFLRALSQGGAAEYRVEGILSEKPQRVGQQIHGVRVMDTLENFPRTVARLELQGEKPQRLILTKDDFDGATVRHLLDQCRDLGIKLDRIPRMTEFRSGNPDEVEVRSIDVEDLLGRPQATLDKQAMQNFIEGRRILVTGAGGSIGSELVRQILAFGPSDIGLLELSEFGLYQIDQEASYQAPDVNRRSLIVDVCKSERVNQIFADFLPDVVFHAAALKHVPLVEENCCEGVSTNVFGTVNIADACIRYGVKTMVQISTDKAINPTNVMGASKRIAEKYCQALDLDRGGAEGTNFVTVRFGNVLGSTGSVVPLFQKQLVNGGPLTVTHPDMTRYFMTVREAVQLVLLASAKATIGAEQDGKIYVLDMGEPVRIMDLAEQMIRLAGFEPGKDIKIEITGCRPGEKLFEEILHDSENVIQTNTNGLLLAAPRTAQIDEIRTALEGLLSECKMNNESMVRQKLTELVPEANLEPLA